MQLLPGSRLALGPVFRLRSSLSQMLVLELDDSLHDGQFTVGATPENGFQFRVSLGKNLFEFLRRRDEHGMRHNIMPHLVTACFALLRQEYSGDDGEQGWASHPNLVALASLCAQKGALHWSDEDFEPAKASTAVYPLRIPNALG